MRWQLWKQRCLGSSPHPKKSQGSLGGFWGALRWVLFQGPSPRPELQHPGQGLLGAGVDEVGAGCGAEGLPVPAAEGREAVHGHEAFVPLPPAGETRERRGRDASAPGTDGRPEPGCLWGGEQLPARPGCSLPRGSRCIRSTAWPSVLLSRLPPASPMCTAWRGHVSQGCTAAQVIVSGSCSGSVQRGNQAWKKEPTLSTTPKFFMPTQGPTPSPEHPQASPKAGVSRQGG